MTTNNLYSRKVVKAAVDLVAAWKASESDDDARSRLTEAVAMLVPDHPIIIDQGRTQRHAAGGGNYLVPAVAAQVVDLLKLGLSHREIRRQIGVAKGTVQRYEVLHGPFVCQCGRPRTHRGWCPDRLKRSPARVAFLANWAASQIERGTYRGRASRRHPILVDRAIAFSNWPYLRGGPGDSQALISAVNAIVPRSFPDHMRADICQDLLLTILEGEATISTLKDGSALAIKRYYKLHPGKFGPVSLDATIPGTDGLKLVDLIASDAAHF